MRKLPLREYFTLPKKEETKMTGKFKLSLIFAYLQKLLFRVTTTAATAATATRRITK